MTTITVDAGEWLAMGNRNAQLIQEVERLTQFLSAATALGGQQIAEIDRLKQCLKWQQDRESHIGTHGDGCYEWGSRHYECAIREIERMKGTK